LARAAAERRPCGAQATRSAACRGEAGAVEAVAVGGGRLEAALGRKKEEAAAVHGREGGGGCREGDEGIRVRVKGRGSFIGFGLGRIGLYGLK